MKSVTFQLTFLFTMAARLSGCSTVRPNEKLNEKSDSQPDVTPGGALPEETIVYKGDPNYVYDSVPGFMAGSRKPTITYSLGEKTDLNDVTDEPGKDYIMLMIDGKLVPKADVISHGGRYFAQIKALRQWLGGETGPAAMAESVDGISYVPLEAVAAALGAEMKYYDRKGFPVNYESILWTDFPFPFPLVVIDPPHEGAEVDTVREAVQRTRELLMTGYGNFAAAIRQSEWYADNKELSEQILDTIKADIERTFYVGEISRYYILRGPYEMLYDKYTRDIYFYQPVNNRFAINSYNYTDDPGLFTLYYFSG